MHLAYDAVKDRYCVWFSNLFATYSAVQVCLDVAVSIIKLFFIFASGQELDRCRKKRLLVPHSRLKRF